MEAVKFFYAADLRLDKPLALGEGGSVLALTPRSRDAAYEAARRLVDCALSRGVDFVLLRGELCCAHCAPKAFIFLAEQIKRLSDAGIACYILNEGAPYARRLAGFSGGVQWISRQSGPEDVIICGTHEVSLARILNPAPPPLQGLAPDETGPGGAWLIRFPDEGAPEREFIELDALRWVSSEMDVTHIQTEEEFAAVWETVKNSLRGQAQRPVLLNLKLTGVTREQWFCYGDDFMRGSPVLIQKLNARELDREDFVLVNSLECQAPAFNWSGPGAEGASPLGLSPFGPSPFEEYFWDEVNFFKSGIDLRIGMLDALKERGLYKRLFAAGPASADASEFLENMTEADAESILGEACGMAEFWLRRGGPGPR